MTMYKPLLNYLERREEELSGIPEERKGPLLKLSEYIRVKQEGGGPASLTFICTHNSRRSHLCQIWAAAAAHRFGIGRTAFFSGGTEVTAFNLRAVAAVERAGFRVENPGGENPRYRIYFDDHLPPVECFSKVYNDSHNPQNNFAAVMTCSEADMNCPLIPGASLRISLPYKDPKEADGTRKESQIYDERCRQIATEICYLMKQVKF